MILKEENTTRKRRRSFLTRGLKSWLSTLSRSVQFFSTGGSSLPLNGVLVIDCLRNAPWRGNECFCWICEEWRVCEIFWNFNFRIPNLQISEFAFGWWSESVANVVYMLKQTLNMMEGAHAALKTSISSYRKTLFPSTLINSRKRFSQIEIWENFANTPLMIISDKSIFQKSLSHKW